MQSLELLSDSQLIESLRSASYISYSQPGQPVFPLLGPIITVFSGMLVSLVFQMLFFLVLLTSLSNRCHAALAN